MHLEDALVEEAECLSGNGAVARRLELPSAAAWPMVTEDRPRPGGRRCGLEVDLDDLAGGEAAHHDMEEHRVFEGLGNLEQSGVIDECHIDAAGIAGIGVDDFITPRCSQHCVYPVDESINDEAVSTSHTPSRSGPWPVFIVAIIEASWSIFRSRNSGVQ